MRHRVRMMNSRVVYIAFALLALSAGGWFGPFGRGGAPGGGGGGGVEIGSGMTLVNEGSSMSGNEPVQLGFGIARGDFPSAAQGIGQISGTTLTLASTSAGTFAIGQWLQCTGCTNGIATITGGSGTSWTVSPSQTVAAGTPISAYSNTITCKDDAGTTLPCQLDEITDRDGMVGASDTGGFIHVAISLIESAAWNNGANHTFHFYRTAGAYSLGTVLPVSALTAAHDYQVLFNNVEDASGNVIGSGNFTCDLNTAIATGSRTQAGGYDLTGTGQIQTTIEALQPCVDNSSHTADSQLAAEFYVSMWQATPGSGTIGNIRIVARLEQPWQNVCPSGCSTTGRTPEFVWGDAELYDATTSTVLRSMSSTTNFAPSDVTIAPGSWTFEYDHQLTWACEGGTIGCLLGAGSTATISGTTITIPAGPFFAKQATNGIYIYLNNCTGCTPGGYQIQSVTNSTTAVLATSPGTGTSTQWQIGGGTITNYDSTQTGEPITFAATGGGTLPLGLTAGQEYFASTLVANNLPGPIQPNRNACSPVVGCGSWNDGVTLASQGSCPSGSCLTITRHTGIDQWTGSWIMADDHGNPFWVGSNTSQLMPALTTAQQTYWETTGLIPPIGSAAGAPAVIPNPYPLPLDTGGVLYRSHSLGPQEANISGAGNHVGTGIWGDLSTNWFLSGSLANWQILNAEALSQSNMYLKVLLNDLTGYPTAYAGVYPGGGNFPLKIGAPQITAGNLGNQIGQPVGTNLFSLPSVPTFINTPDQWETASFSGGFGGCCGGNPAMSHEPDFGTSAVYLMTGAPWMRVATQMSANFPVVAMWPTQDYTLNYNRNFTINGVQYQGKVVFGPQEEPRGYAWGMRNIVQALIGSDNDPVRIYDWNLFRWNIDADYAFIHQYWAGGLSPNTSGNADPGFETMGVLDGVDNFSDPFMEVYVGGAFALAHMATHYVSSTLSGASTLYALNQAMIDVVNLQTLIGTVPDAQGHVVSPFWAPTEEGMQQTQPSAVSGVLPNNPPTITNVNQEYIGSVVTWRGASVSTAGVLTTTSPEPYGNEWTQNGDQFLGQTLDSNYSYTYYGTSPYWAVNVQNQGTSSISLQLSATPPSVQACSGPTGNTGCPAAFVPSISGTTSMDFVQRPQYAPAAPLTQLEQNLDPGGYQASQIWDFRIAANAGSTTPNLSAALTTALTRYNPGDTTSTFWQPWYAQSVTVPYETHMQHDPEMPTKAAPCKRCGAMYKEQTCVPNHARASAGSRAIPPSIFAGDITAIGDRGREIATEEWKAVAESNGGDVP